VSAGCSERASIRACTGESGPASTCKDDRQALGGHKWTPTAAGHVV
jgi:hypothetical protein